MLLTMLKAGGLLVGFMGVWLVFAAAVLDLMFWADAPRASRRRVRIASQHPTNDAASTVRGY
jgi:hypothetical protein